MNNSLLHGACFPGETLGKHLRDLRNEKARGPHRLNENFEEHLDAVERWLKNGAEIGHIDAGVFDLADLEFEFQRQEAEFDWGNQTLLQILEKIEVIHDHARIRAKADDVPSEEQLWELEQSLYGPDEDHFDGDEDMVNYLDMYLE